MATYTTTVRTILESTLSPQENVGADDIEKLLTADRMNAIIGLYPIENENHRNELNTKIFSHYFMREIGYETVGLWKFNLRRKMAEIMPYYNKLFYSADLEYNPLWDVDRTAEISGTKNSASQTINEHNSTTNVTTTGGLTQHDTQTDTGTNKKAYSESGSTSENSTSDKSGETKRAESGNLSVNVEASKSEKSATSQNQNVTTNSTDSNTDKSGASSNSYSSGTSNGVTSNKSADSTGATSDTTNKAATNKWQLINSTPQGGIEGLVNAGKGIRTGNWPSDVTGDSNVYLTAAEHDTQADDSTSVVNSSTSEAHESNGTTTNSNTNETSGNSAEERVHNGSSSENSVSTASNAGELTGTSTDNRTEQKSNANTENYAVNVLDTSLSDSSKSGAVQDDSLLETVGDKTVSSNGESQTGIEGGANTRNAGSENDTRVEHIYGKSPGRTYSRMVMEYRDAILNIDMMIINDLADLFMRVW